MGIFANAATCKPPLCANALLPTYACRWSKGCLHAFATKDAVCVSRFTASVPSGRHRLFILSSKFPATTNTSAFPVLSPYPLTHPCTMRAPPFTPASEFATARLVSLCACVPRRHTSFKFSERSA